MGVHVPRTRPPYPPEFRAEAVRLLRATGKSPQQVADDLGVSRQSVANWARQADLDDGLRDDGLTPPSARSCAGCAARSVTCARSGRSSRRLRLSSQGRPIAGELLPADRGGEGTPSRLP